MRGQTPCRTVKKVNLRKTVTLLAVAAILLAVLAPGASLLFLAVVCAGPLLSLALLAERRGNSEKRRPRPFPLFSPLASRAPPCV